MTRNSYWDDDFDYYGVPAEPATSVVPVREKNGGIEVYLTKRQESLRFMGGFHVFPGGKVDDADCDPLIADFCAGLDPRSALEKLGGGMAPELAVGYWVAGIRELFEEAGILMAYDLHCEFPDFNSKATRLLFDDYRKKIHGDEITLIEMLEREKLTLATDRLFYLSHWVTPPGSSRRFDTRFFVTVPPDTQRARFVEAEISEGYWLDVNEAIKQARDGDLLMILPTFMCIEEVARHRTIEKLCRELGAI